MSELEKYIIVNLEKLVPNAEGFDVRANISDKSYSFEFFAIIEGVKYQCYDMIDEGRIEEKDFDVLVKQIAKYVRMSPEYRHGEVNKFSFTTTE